VNSVPVSSEHIAVEKEKGVQRLILGGGGYVALRCKVGEVLPHVTGFKFTRMARSVKADVPDDPSNVGLLCTVAVAPAFTGGANQAEEFA